MNLESGLESTLKDLKEFGCDYCSGNYTECKNYNDPLKWKDIFKVNKTDKRRDVDLWWLSPDKYGIADLKKVEK